MNKAFVFGLLGLAASQDLFLSSRQQDQSAVLWGEFVRWTQDNQKPYANVAAQANATITGCEGYVMSPSLYHSGQLDADRPLCHVAYSFASFASWHQYIDEHNSKKAASAGYWLGLNDRHDVSWKDFPVVFLVDFAALGPPPPAAQLPNVSRSGALQASFWKMPPAKNQGGCGSCWLFGGMAAVDHLNGKTGLNVASTLSEQQVMDCSPRNCNGGYPSNAFDYIKTAGGVMSEAEYPYKGKKNPTCKFNRGEIVGRISGYSQIAPKSAPRLKAAVNGQVVSFCMGVKQDWCAYKSGVLTSCGSTGGGGHCLALTGYTDGSIVQQDGYGLKCYNDAPKGARGSCILWQGVVSNFNDCSTKCKEYAGALCAAWSFAKSDKTCYVLNHKFSSPHADSNGVIGFPNNFYLVRNSWGAGYGEYGYVRMAIGQNICGIESGAHGGDNNAWVPH